MKIEDAEAAISNIKDSWYWNQKLVVKFPSFLKKEDVQNPRNSLIRNHPNKSRPWSQNDQHNQRLPFKYKPNQWKQNPQVQPFKGKETTHQQNSYVKKGQNQQKFTEQKRGKEVWRRKGIEETSRQGEQRNAIVYESPAKVHMGNIKVQPVGNGWLFKSAFAKMNRLVSTKDLEHIFRKEGDIKVQIKAIGGRFIIIIFPDKASRDLSIKEKWLSNWFEEIRPWGGEQASEERFVWLSCYGMPLNAWSNAVFEEIGNKWGQFLQVDEATLKEYSFVKAKILIATNHIHKLEGYVDLIIDEVIYSVRVMEENSFRVINQSFFDTSSELAMETKDSFVEDDDKAGSSNEVEISADVGSKHGSQQNNSCSEEDANSNNETGVPPFINEVALLDSMNSSLGKSNSLEKCEMVADSFEKLPSVDQPQFKIPNCLPIQDTILMIGKTGVQLENEALNDKEEKATEFSQEELACNIANEVNNEEQIDHFEENQAPIQATIKGIKGKRNRKSIDEILGYSKVNTRETKGKRNKKKCVVLRSAVASAALSASISSGEINNRNRILLNEAQAIWAVDKLFGISYDGEEEEVINRIAEMEALNKARAGEQP